MQNLEQQCRELIAAGAKFDRSDKSPGAYPVQVSPAEDEYGRLCHATAPTIAQACLDLLKRNAELEATCHKLAGTDPNDPDPYADEMNHPCAFARAMEDAAKFHADREATIAALTKRIAELEKVSHDTP